MSRRKPGPLPAPSRPLHTASAEGVRSIDSKKMPWLNDTLAPLFCPRACTRLGRTSGTIKTMHSVLVCNDHGKILLSRYFEPQSLGSESAFSEGSLGDSPLQQGLMRDTAKARSSSQAEVLGETRHLWKKGTADCPQVARAKVCQCQEGDVCRDRRGKIEPAPHSLEEVVMGAEGGGWGGVVRGQSPVMASTARWISQRTAVQFHTV